MTSQERRGGGTIAFQDPKLWKFLKLTDNLIPPKGMSQVDAKAIIQETHGGSVAKPKAKSKARAKGG
jgi:deoxyribonuclease-2